MSNTKMMTLSLLVFPSSRRRDSSKPSNATVFISLLDKVNKGGQQYRKGVRAMTACSMQDQSRHTKRGWMS